MMIGTFRRRREAIFQTLRRSRPESWRRDLLQFLASLAFLGLLIGFGLWCHLS